MAYEKTNWVDKQTPLNAENLNKIEAGIENNSVSIDEIKSESLPNFELFKEGRGEEVYLGYEWEGLSAYQAIPPLYVRLNGPVPAGWRLQLFQMKRIRNKTEKRSETRTRWTHPQDGVSEYPKEFTGSKSDIVAVGLRTCWDVDGDVVKLYDGDEQVTLFGTSHRVNHNSSFLRCAVALVKYENGKRFVGDMKKFTIRFYNPETSSVPIIDFMQGEDRAIVAASAGKSFYISIE